MTPQRPIVLIFNTYFLPAYKGGGPIRTLEALIMEHNDKYRFQVFTSNKDLGDSTPLPVRPNSWQYKAGYSIYYATPSSPWKFMTDLLKLCRGKYDYVYLNSFFSPLFSILPLFLFRLKALRAKHVVLAPRGELGDAPLAIKALKKRAFLTTGGLFRFHSGVVWHASSPQEEKEVLSLFPRSTVVVRQNEVALPLTASTPPKRDPGSPLRFVYAGRLAEKKGVHLAIDALMAAPSPCRLDIVGSFEDKRYESLVRERITKLPSHVQVTEYGALPHSEVLGAFLASDYFIFPTAHENFGHTVVESLSASCPVLIADVTPFTATVATGGGLVVSSLTADAWRAAIESIFRRDDREHAESRVSAARAYNQWRALPASPSVFELAEEM